MVIAIVIVGVVLAVATLRCALRNVAHQVSASDLYQSAAGASASSASASAADDG
jgi:hypothetical protein